MIDARARKNKQTNKQSNKKNMKRCGPMLANALRTPKCV